MPTFMDIVKANAADREVGLIDESVRLVPEVMFGEARPIKGISYRTLVRTALGNTSGSFRSANQGTKPPVHTYENRLVECYISEPRFQADKAVADAYEDGAAAYISMDTGGTLQGEMQALGKQFYYGAGGTIGNAKGHPGLIDQYDATNMVVDAGGTTAATGSSVWFVTMGPADVKWVLGNGGTFAFSPVRIESVIDSADATMQTKFDAYVQTMLFRPGLQVGSLWSTCRIKKLTADVGHTLTDALITQALAKFPAGRQPNLCLMHRRSLQQLQASRTATTTTGQPAPFPTEIQGIAGQNIPIKLTEGLSVTESLTL